MDNLFYLQLIKNFNTNF